MGLNRKDIDLLEEINEKVLPIKYFADKYSVSERNIRYGIENINFYLKKEDFDEIEIKKGNLVFSADKEKLNSFVKNLDMITYVFSQEERESYILTKYLFEENVTLKEIETFLNVSRTTIKKDLKNVNEQISYFELYFLRDDNRIEISGNEKKLRHLKLLKLLDYVELKGKVPFLFSKKYLNEKLESEIIKKYVDKYYEENIFNSIIEIEKAFNTKFPKQFKNIITLYLTVTIERISKKYIITRKGNSEFLRTLDEYKSIQKVLGKIIDVKHEYEILHLLEYFLSGQYINYFYENFFIAERFINRVLRTLEKSMDKKFSINKELNEKLLKYLIPAIYRIKNNFKLYKNLDIQKIDKKIFEKVKNVVIENNKYLLEPLRDEEIVYIAECIEEYLHYENIKKISLKDLIGIIEKNSKEVNTNIITKEIMEKYSMLIENDISSESENKNIFSLLLSKSMIYLSDKSLKFTEAMDIGINLLVKNGCAEEKRFQKLKYLAKNNGNYMFVEEKILFCSDTDNENYLKEGLSIVISKEGIKVNEEIGNILFILVMKNKNEYLKTISELMNLFEKKELFTKLISLKNSDEILKNLLKSI